MRAQGARARHANISHISHFWGRFQKNPLGHIAKPPREGPDPRSLSCQSQEDQDRGRLGRTQHPQGRWQLLHPCSALHWVWRVENPQGWALRAASGILLDQRCSHSRRPSPGSSWLLSDQRIPRLFIPALRPLRSTQDPAGKPPSPCTASLRSEGALSSIHTQTENA